MKKVIGIFFGTSLFLFGTVSAQTSGIDPKNRSVRTTQQTWALACPAPQLVLSDIFDKSREEILKSHLGWSFKFSLPSHEVEYQVIEGKNKKPFISEKITSKDGNIKEASLSNTESQDFVIGILRAIQPVEITGADRTKHSISLIDPANIGVCRSDSERFLWRGKRVDATVKQGFDVTLSLNRPGEAEKKVNLGESLGYALSNRDIAFTAMGISQDEPNVCLFRSNPADPLSRPEAIAMNVAENEEPLKSAVLNFRELLGSLKSADTGRSKSETRILGSKPAKVASQFVEPLQEGLALRPVFAVTTELSVQESISVEDILAASNIKLFAVSDVIQNKAGEITGSKLTPVELLSPTVVESADKKSIQVFIRTQNELQPNQMYLLASPNKLTLTDSGATANYLLRYFKTVDAKPSGE